MVDLATLYPHQNWGVLTQHFTKEAGPLAFAHTNSLLALSNQTQQPIIHFWTLTENVILGMMDTKLPAYPQATQALTTAHYAHFVRNAGGLGIVSDDGVLNISFYLPAMANRLTIKQAYALMHQLFTTTFTDYPVTIDHFEVTHSYCPGEYDLSINGQKFAGIAQRRAKNGIAVLLYASINGDQLARGQLMHTFYTAGQAHTQTRWTFPDVIPDTMANLADLLDYPLSVNTAIQHLQAAFCHLVQQPQLIDLTVQLKTATYQQLLLKNQTALKRYQI
ncbi:lipoyl protein ligase domain-containing protein [Latilactobacillus graminis]|uniref:Lipoate--protein ligase n=1 Tax=Latilactobacillus graminis TaxID=60519 RepID=A0ABX6C656_9LACO|nr:lipoate--protein ligase [Latilactobacillus graminis]QFP79048.1 lipoate--protein ligase [Latilactobacillus graminis]